MVSKLAGVAATTAKFDTSYAADAMEMMTLFRGLHALMTSIHGLHACDTTPKTQLSCVLHGNDDIIPWPPRQAI